MLFNSKMNKVMIYLKDFSTLLMLILQIIFLVKSTNKKIKKLLKYFMMPLKTFQLKTLIILEFIQKV